MSMNELDKLRKQQETKGNRIHPVIGNYIKHDTSNSLWDWEYLTGYCQIDGKLEKVYNPLGFIKMLKLRFGYELVGYHMLTNPDDPSNSTSWVIRTFTFKLLPKNSVVSADKLQDLLRDIDSDFESETVTLTINGTFLIVTAGFED